MYFSQLTENFGEIAGAAVLVWLCILTLTLTSKPGIPENQYYDLFDLMKNYVGSDDPTKMEDRGNGDARLYPRDL